MRNSHFLALGVALAIFVCASMIGDGEPAGSSFMAWFAPLESAELIGFAFAFATGMPEWLARLVGFFAIFGVPVLAYVILRKVFMRISSAK